MVTVITMMVMVNKALWSAPPSPGNPLAPVDTVEAAKPVLLSILLPVLLHYVPARHLGGHQCISMPVHH